jgi:hypothetical protein
MTSDFEFSEHATERMEERKVTKEEVLETINSPDEIEHDEDGKPRYVKIIINKGKKLKVVVNEEKEPNLVVTVFLERLRR